MTYLMFVEGILASAAVVVAGPFLAVLGRLRAGLILAAAVVLTAAFAPFPVLLGVASQAGIQLSRITVARHREYARQNRVEQLSPPGGADGRI